MDERRPDSPAAGPARPAASVAALAPPQQAYGRYVQHALHCECCRDIDAGPCPTAEGLRRAWLQLADGAFEALNGETT